MDISRFNMVEATMKIEGFHLQAHQLHAANRMYRMIYALIAAAFEPAFISFHIMACLNWRKYPVPFKHIQENNMP